MDIPQWMASVHRPPPLSSLDARPQPDTTSAYANHLSFRGRNSHNHFTTPFSPPIFPHAAFGPDLSLQMQTLGDYHTRTAPGTQLPALPSAAPDPWSPRSPAPKRLCQYLNRPPGPVELHDTRQSGVMQLAHRSNLQAIVGTTGLARQSYRGEGSGTGDHLPGSSYRPQLPTTMLGRAEYDSVIHRSTSSSDHMYLQQPTFAGPAYGYGSGPAPAFIKGENHQGLFHPGGMPSGAPYTDSAPWTQAQSAPTLASNSEVYAPPYTGRDQNTNPTFPFGTDRGYQRHLQRPERVEPETSFSLAAFSSRRHTALTNHDSVTLAPLGLAGGALNRAVDPPFASDSGPSAPAAMKSSNSSQTFPSGSRPIRSQPTRPAAQPSRVAWDDMADSWAFLNMSDAEVMEQQQLAADLDDTGLENLGPGSAFAPISFLIS